MSDTPEPSRDALDVRLARLPRELTPARDLWPGIEARLRGPARGRLGLGLAAGIAVLALLGLVLLQLSRTAPRNLSAAGSPAAAASARAADAAPRAARDAAYVRTEAAVEQSFEQELARLPKPTQIRLRQDLEIIRSARADIRRALDAAPENPLLQQLFADTWQQEMDFYTTVASTNNPAGARWPM
jgi:hypothetical protein